MALSVASECAFSSASITISMQWNRLDGDIVEALQCLKSLKSEELMLQVFPSVADEEVLQDSADLQPGHQVGTTHEIVNEAEGWSWDAVVEDTYCQAFPCEHVWDRHTVVQHQLFQAEGSAYP